MGFRFLPDPSIAAVRMPPGQTVLIDPGLRPHGHCLEVLDGMARNGDAGDAQVEHRVKEQAMALCARFPIY